MLNPCRLLLWQLVVKLSYHVLTVNACLRSDIFARVQENSPMGQFIANLSVTGDPEAKGFRLCITGRNADWFFLEGQTIRLNASFSRGLDRELLGPILMAELTCYVDDIIQSQYRLMVEVLNENDNQPKFVEKTIQPFFISELTAVNSVVFTVKAVDADGDIITYIIDKSLPDANYFRIDWPNTGKVLLDKPLDYESKTQLQLVICAMEQGTRERYNTSAILTVNVEDGDDQYPHFLPCTPASPDVKLPICTNPFYTTNITGKDQDMVLDFSPGPVHAEDGDRALNTPLTYVILSGADQGRFKINNQTGEINLTRPVGNPQLTPTFRLHIMASQVNDPMKYTVATALIRVLADNGFPPHFNQTTYKGFVIQSASPATIVSTYGNQVLLIQATDEDYRDGINPKMDYSLHPLSASEGLYHITREGVLIARTDQLQAFDRHILQVVARDDESGEVATASVDVEVLPRGQPVPRGPFREEQLFGDMDTKMAGGIAAVLLLLLVAALFLILRTVRRRRRRQDRDDPGVVALGKHANVVNAGQPVHFEEELSFSNEAFISECEPSGSGSLHGRRGIYTRRQSLAPPAPLVPVLAPGGHREGHDPPSSGARTVLAKAKSRDPHCTLQYQGHAGEKSSGMGAAGKHRSLENVLEKSEKPGTQLFPDVKEEPLSAGRSQSATSGADAALPGHGHSSVGALQGRGSVENPYSAMHAVICLSDEGETSTDEELCAGRRRATQSVASDSS